MSLAGRMVLGLLLAIGVARAAAAAESYSKTTLTEDGKSVSNVAFSADGTKVVITLAEDAPAARLKDVAGGEGTLLQWDGRIGYLAAFSPDGTKVVIATIDYGLSVWDVASGSRIATLTPPREQLYAADFSPDGGRLVIAAGDDTARILDIASGRELAVLRGHAGDVYDAAWSPDGARIVTASRDRTARVWDAATARETVRLDHDDAVHAADWSFDGTRIATGAGGGKVQLFDAGGVLQRTFTEAEAGDILAVAFSRDGKRVVSGADDRTARIRDAASGELLATLTGHLAPVYSVAFSPGGDRVLSAAHDGTGRIWTRLEPAKMPDGVAGLWYQNLTTPEPMPDELVRHMCLNNPFNIHPDGLIVSFMGFSETEPPEVQLHLRCAADLWCQVFVGPPAESVEAPVETGKLTLAAGGGELCFGGECRMIAQCPAIAWTEGEKASGFAAAWEAKVMGPAQ